MFLVVVEIDLLQSWIKSNRMKKAPGNNEEVYKGYQGIMDLY